MTSEDNQIRRTGAAILTIVACLYGAIGLIVYSAYRWIRDGTWPHIDLRSLATPPRLPWLQAQQIVDWLWYVPLFSGLLLAAVLLAAALHVRR